MAKIAEMYTEEPTVANEIKGFTKSFEKRSKSKKAEDLNVKELLAYERDKMLILGTRVAEKGLKNGKLVKVYTSSNCDELVFKKLNHYCKITGVDVVKLDLDNEELGQKLQKPFLVSVVSVLGGKNGKKN
ncbi:MAG: ribosomal L7Ae/L30e/S12e/Gadd45 family protein [Nanoarchaeota archaeon]